MHGRRQTSLETLVMAAREVWKFICLKTTKVEGFSKLLEKGNTYYIAEGGMPILEALASDGDDVLMCYSDLASAQAPVDYEADEYCWLLYEREFMQAFIYGEDN